MIFKIANASVLSNDINTTASWKTENIVPSYIKAEEGDWNFQKREGMLYVAVRAVSVGTNGNGDHFTEDELRKGYKTFIGKGVYVNHASNDVEKMRGMIVDAKWIEAGPSEKYVVCLLEMNEIAHPEFCRMIRSGQIRNVSMGVHVSHSECSICAHSAKTTKDYCLHVKMHKGGVYNGRPVYEINRGLDFIEVSWVTVGADPQARLLEVYARKKGLDFHSLLQKAASGIETDVDITEKSGRIEQAIFNGIRRAKDKRFE
jgi:hypothetical protein